MAFALWNPPFTAFTSVISSAFLNFLRVCASESIDGTGGSVPGFPYTPSNPIVINGAGLVADPFSGFVRNGGYLKIDSGATFDAIYGAIFNVHANATFFSPLLLFNGCTVSVANGPWTFNYDAYQLLGHTFHIGDNANGVGHLLIDGSGAGAGSDLKLKGNAVAEWQTGTTLQMDGGSTATLGGTNTMSGATTASNLVSATQTGPFLKSGANARTGLRAGGPATTDADNTFDPTQWDFIPCDNGGVSFGATRTWKLLAPGGGVSCARVTFHAGGIGAVIGGGNAINFQNSAGSQIAHMTASHATVSTLDLVWTAATDWVPTAAGNAFASDV